MIWIRIHSEPLRQFFIDERVREFLDPKAAKHRLLKTPGDIRSATSGETPNVTAEFHNDAGQCSALFADDPPIGYLAEWMDDDAAIFSGTVETVTLDRLVCTIEVRA